MTKPFQLQRSTARVIIVTSSLAALILLSQWPTLPEARAQKLEAEFEAVVSGVHVNLIAGDVSYERNNARLDAITGLDMLDDDLLTTKQEGRAELLLQPGNYLRLWNDTKLRLASKNYDRMVIELDYGSINLELIKNTWERSGFSESLMNYDLIRVVTPRSEILVTQPGILRINVSKDGSTDVIVRKGESIVNGQRVREKRLAHEAKNLTSVTEQAVSDDAFDNWCRERAALLVKANRTLKKDAPWAEAKKKGADTIVDFPKLETSGSNAYVVSAKPGKITFADTEVEINQDAKEWKKLSLDAVLKSGDEIRTSAHNRVELMLFPDINLRVDGDSALFFTTLTNDYISLTLKQGSLILDVAIFDRKTLPQISIAGRKLSAIVSDDGNYRIDVSTDSEAITVRDGKLIVSGRRVGSCRRIGLNGEVECDKKVYDNFDYWSQSRGEGLSPNGRGMVSHLARLRQRKLRSSGFWFLPAGLGYYTFVPFFSADYDSPYGGNYSMVLSPRSNRMLNPFRRTSRGDLPETVSQPPISRP